ncbi:hypothetical protein [Acinetobacter defluvii]|uniref:hypothetical protein n=1 Tax=Acinetobacter defluvii TaxID=1871111 RepID=UPI003AF7CDA4
MSNSSDYYHLRRFLAVLCFIAAFVCLGTFFLTDLEHYILLILMVFLFILAYFIAPYSQARRSGKYDVAQEIFLDQWLIEGFFYVIAYPIRIIFSLIRHILD